MATDDPQQLIQEGISMTRDELRAVTLDELLDIIRAARGGRDSEELNALFSAYALGVELVTLGDRSRIEELQRAVEASATRMLRPDTDGIRAVLVEMLRRAFQYELEMVRDDGAPKAVDKGENQAMTESVSRPELDAKLDALRQEMRADSATLRADIARFSTDITQAVAATQGSMTSMAEKLGETSKLVENLKWWLVGAVVTIAVAVYGASFSIQQMTVQTFQAGGQQAQQQQQLLEALNKLEAKVAAGAAVTPPPAAAAAQDQALPGAPAHRPASGNK